MVLISVQDLSIGFRGPTLLDGVSCHIEPGQRIGLLGCNGAGKTTFMRMLSGEQQPDAGQVQLAAGVRIALLPQGVPQDIEGPIAKVVATGLPADADPDLAWQHEHQIEKTLAMMSLEPEVRFETLSSGMKRRVLLAKALVASPDVLLLDEPTNHLDVGAITWLEDFLLRWPGTLLFVTHDRMFLRKLATRILEIDRGQLFDWSCDYDTFLERKEAALAAEDKQAALFDKRLAEEERWIRQGIKARRTRNEGRVRALEKMRVERSQRRTTPGKAKLVIQEGQKSGALVTATEDISFAYADRPIVQGFSTLIMRGDKIGIIGPNGAGKTTLLRLLLGQLEPQSGTVRTGTNLQIAYFDQLRQQLDEHATVQENVGDGYDTININGQSRHILGYLQDFLFSPERARTEVRFLSGGERNRILLAKLFAKPANIIVLDEPTNDLDSETLEMLEERLAEFNGTVLVVSHDRMFLNNVVTSSIVFEEGNIREYVGGYDDWLRQRESKAAVAPEKPQADKSPSSTTASPQKSAETSSAVASKKRKLNNKEQQELKTLPQTIERLETEVGELHSQMGEADFYQQPGDKIAQSQARLQKLEADLAHAYQRWEELEPHA